MEQLQPDPDFLNVAEMVARGDDLLARAHQFSVEVEERVGTALANEPPRLTPAAERSVPGLVPARGAGRAGDASNRDS